MGVDRRFEAIVFGWDGTAVPDRESDASEIRRVIEAGCAAGLHFVVVTGTHVGNVDDQLQARPGGPGKLLLALNRGSEVFEVGRDGPQLVARRDATPEEDAALDRAADLTVARLGQHGVTAKIVSQRLNRRKVDVIPLPEWADPSNTEIDHLLAAVEQRLRDAGIGGLPEVVALAEDAAREAGLSESKVSCDVKHVEIGLTDTTDSSKWVFDWLWARGVGPGLVLVAGDQLGPLGGLPGRDSRVLVGKAERATAISVGVEPMGVPEGVLHLPGGPARFVELVADQLERRRRGDVPDVDCTPGWTLAFDGVDPEHERAHAALLTLADGRIGSNGSPTIPDPSAVPRTLTAGVYDGAGPETQLLSGPVWYRIGGDPTGGRGIRRVLDVRTGLLHESTADGDGSRDGNGSHSGDAAGYRSLRLSSLRRPGTVALRIDHSGGVGQTPRLLELLDGERAVEDVVSPGRHTMRIAASEGGGLAASAHERATDAPGGGRERFGVFVTDPAVLPETESSQRAVRNAAAAGFDEILAEHREAWAERWEDADVVIDGDDQMQLAVRTRAVPHLRRDDRPRRGGRRRARRLRAWLPRSRVLGLRRLRAPGAGRDAPTLGPGDARVPVAPTSRSARRGRRRGSPRRAVPVGIGTQRSRRHPDVGARPHRPCDPDPYRAARDPHQRLRSVGGDGLRGLDRRSRVRRRARAHTVDRDRALLGLAHPCRRRRCAHLWRHRTRRVPRAGRRQRVHERDGAVDPETGGGRRGVRTARWRGDRDRGGAPALARPCRAARRRLRPDHGHLRGVRRLPLARAAARDAATCRTARSSPTSSSARSACTPRRS